MFEALLHPYKKINIFKLPFLKVYDQNYVDVKYLMLHIDMMQFLINKKLQKNYHIPISMYDCPNQICEIYTFMQEKLYRVEYDRHYVNTLSLFLFCENMNLIKYDHEYRLVKDTRSYSVQNCYELICLISDEIKSALYDEFFYQYTNDLSYQLVHTLSKIHTLNEIYQLALEDEKLCMSIDMPLLYLYLHYEHIPALKEHDLLVQLYVQLTQFAS